MNDKKFINAKVSKSLRKLFGNPHLSHYELQRLNILSSMVSSILITGRSELSQMALGNSDRKQHASKVKQYKRLLLNENLSHQTHFLPFIEPLLKTLSASGELSFSIDGSVLGRGCMCLMFSVVYKGKAIPVVWQVYKAKKGHLPEDAHRSLLSMLGQLIPDGCQVFIMGDGEFDGCDWQADILENGWNYALRTGKNVRILQGEEIFKPHHIGVEPGGDCFFESIGFTQKEFRTNLLIWHGKGHKEPLYLVTNLNCPPLIKQLYRKRFKIEPFFRDQKSKGFHIQKSGLSDPRRLERLLIATCLAYILAVMGGLKASTSKLYGEITRKDGDFLSIFQLGYRFLLLLVDLREWRTFSWEHDFKLQKPTQYEIENCVPF